MYRKHQGYKIVYGFIYLFFGDTSFVLIEKRKCFCNSNTIKFSFVFRLWWHLLGSGPKYNRLISNVAVNKASLDGSFLSFFLSLLIVFLFDFSIFLHWNQTNSSIHRFLHGFPITFLSHSVFCLFQSLFPFLSSASSVSCILSWFLSLFFFYFFISSFPFFIFYSFVFIFFYYYNSPFTYNLFLSFCDFIFFLSFSPCNYFVLFASLFVILSSFFLSFSRDSFHENDFYNRCFLCFNNFEVKPINVNYSHIPIRFTLKVNILWALFIVN